MTDFTYDLDQQGVATITWDTPNKSMNVLSRDAAALLDSLVDRALGDDAVKGVVITSGKDSFAAGMDLNVLGDLRREFESDPAQGIFDWVMSAHAMLRKIERSGMDPKTLKGGKPIAAALPGTALGIGLELPLACHRIFSAENPKAKIGLPEILVGLFPGAGGTTRLSRKLGLMAASPFLLEGKLVDPARAKSSGLIDEVVPADDLLAKAKEWVLAATDADIVKPWDQKREKIPGGGPYQPAGFMTYVGASAMINGKTKGVYPAAKAMMSAAYEGALVPFDTALKIEARWFTNVLLDPSSAAMIRSLFVNKEALEKGANRPDVADETVKRVGILGAGMMGAGIAFVAAKAGIDVILLDQDQAAADRGKDHSVGILDKGIQRRKITQETKDAVLARITTTTQYASLSACDLIVEAVFEDPKIKANVTQATEAVLSPSAIFATNTSTLPISQLAKASKRPEQYIGLHFFSPVDKMNLVEIIKGRETGDRAVAKALDFVRQIRKTPIVVNDERFFYANRCIIPYLNEGLRMIAEGVAPALIENAAKLVGMPLGPLQLADETSIDLGAKIARATMAALGDAYVPSPSDDVLFWMMDQNRLGRKAKAGFYTYDDKGKRDGLWDGLGAQYPQLDEQPNLAEVQNRLLFAQVNEAVQAFEAGVLEDIREGDVGAILGWGFAPWSGGPFSWLDILGAGRAVEICDELQAAHGPRFAAPALLRNVAVSGDTFYGRYGSGESKPA